MALSVRNHPQCWMSLPAVERSGACSMTSWPSTCRPVSSRPTAPRRVRSVGECLRSPARFVRGRGLCLGINHFVDTADALREMARVAPVVALSTWLRPRAPYAPKRIVEEALERHVGRSRSPMGDIVDQLGLRVGSVSAVNRLLGDAGLDACAREVEVAVPWPGTAAFLDYRLSMPSSPEVADGPTARRGGSRHHRARRR